MSQVAEPSSSSQSQESQQNQGKNPSRSKLVQRLLDASSSLPVFVNDLLTAQAVLVAGTEAAAFLMEKQGDAITLKAVAHIRPDDSDADTRAQALKAFQSIIQQCLDAGKDGAIEIGAQDGGDMQFCLVTRLRSEGDVVAASAVVTRCRDQERAQQRLSSMQLVAGYFELFSLRRYTEQAKTMAERHQHVLQYAGAIGTAEGFESAAMNLCNELATRSGASRVALGWVKGVQIKVKALSHTEKFDKKQELVVQLQKVMEECLDQEEPVRFDPSGASTANVTRSAAELSRMSGNTIVLSMPLRRRDELVGVLTAEFPAQELDPAAEASMSVAAELVAPQLFDRYENDHVIFVKMWHTLKAWTKLAIGPKHNGAKLLIAASIGLIVFVTTFHMTYHVTAPFQLAAKGRFTISAPYESFLEKVLIKPGQPVHKGDVIAVLRTDELEKQLNAKRNDAERKVSAAKAAREQNKMAEAEMARYEAAAANDEAGLLQFRIDQASLRSPADGVLLRGDLVDRPGMPVRPGDVLFEVAQGNPETGRITVEAEIQVTERDIQEVKKLYDDRQLLLKETRGDGLSDIEKGELKRIHSTKGRLEKAFDGELATSSLPRDGFKFNITRVVPLGEPKEGENAFKIYADVQDPAVWMHPGLAGEASINIDQRTLYWIWTHRPYDWVRLKLWTWF